MKRNFLILLLISIFVPLATVGISLAIYSISGDKHLDRSRPGFMPEPDDDSPVTPEFERFSDTGPINYEVLDEYLYNLTRLTTNLDHESLDFSTYSLSDEALGLVDEIPENGF